MNTVKRYPRLVGLFLMLCHVGAECGEIHDAARDGDPVLVAELIREEPSLLNATDADGYAALHHAVLRDKIWVVRTLILRGADLNILTRSGCSPLKLAMGLGRQEIANLLEANGAKVIEPKISVNLPPIRQPVVPSRPIRGGVGSGGSWTASIDRKECMSCGRAVPKTSRAGEKCPHCRALWDREVTVVNIK